MFTTEIELKHIVVIAALYIIIVIALGFAVRVVPYSKDNLFAVEFPYEGFTLTPSTYVTEPPMEPFSAIDGKSESADCKKVSGFNELYCAPNYTPPNNDKFSGTPGGASDNSYGLTNSMGKLQLTKEQIELLSTRGGNSREHKILPVSK
jgi:hypothetical protein